jgi:uncharacterized membrane protein YfcA
VILLLTFGLLIGAVMGLTGAGGGILAIPALMLALDRPMAEVVPLALLAVAVSAAIGAWGGWRAGQLRYRAAILMAVAGIPFTLLGMHFGASLEERQRSWLFIALMLYIGVRQWRRLVAEQLPLTQLSLWQPLDARSGRIVWSWTSGAIAAVIGACTGMATGLLGVGGGFIVVPLLQRYSNVSVQGIIATALMVIALVSGTGALLALAQGASFPLTVALPFVSATTAGMLAGRSLATHLPPRFLQTGFAALVFLVAVTMACENLLA